MMISKQFFGSRQGQLAHPQVIDDEQRRRRSSEVTQ
jgi:hypothetical protein